jgi:hypothetical protein
MAEKDVLKTSVKSKADLSGDTLGRFFSRYIYGMNFISFSILSALFVLFYRFVTGHVGGPGDAAILSIVGCWGFYFLKRLKLFDSERLARTIKIFSIFIERHAHLLLFFFILTHLAWSGFVIFLNPFEWGYNHGDAVFSSQTLWNLVDGFRPENSYFTFPDGVPEGADPRYTMNAGYVNLFSLHQPWLSILVLPWIYAVYPFPPMHLFAPFLLIVGAGLPGMFRAVRASGGSKTLALLAAVGYILLPHVEILIFFKGYFDVLALGVMPWVFAALFARKWWLFYVASLCLAAVSYPYTYTVMIIGTAAALFFRATLQGIIVFLIGFFMMKWDSAVFIASVLPYYKEIEAIPSFFESYILNRTVGSLIGPFKIYISYIGSMLLAGGFLPLLGLYRNSKWNFEVAGLLVIAGIGLVPLLFRSVGWEVARNSTLIVPLYLCAFKTFIDIGGNQEEAKQLSFSRNSSAKVMVTICLLCSMVSIILIGNDYQAPSPLASHYPWGENAKLKPTELTRKQWEVVEQFGRTIPHDAQLAFRAEGNFEALMANRKHGWHIGREPKGVQYHAFVGELTGTGSEKLIENMRRNEVFKPVYEGSSVPMVIFENQNAHPVPRNENLLGWGVLLRGFKFLF